MDWSLVIFIVVVAFFAYRGYKNGLIKSLSRVLSLLAGYIAAILFTPQVAENIEYQFQLQGIAAFISASLVLFFGAGIALSVLFWLWEKMRPADGNISVMSSFGGLTMGLVVGGIVAIITVWIFGFTRDMGVAQNPDAYSKTKKSSIESLSRRAASKVVESAMSLSSANPEVTRLSAALVESPAKITQHAQRLASSDDLTALLNDPHNQAVLNKGDVQAVQELYAFKQLARNPDMQTLAKSAGMLGKSGEDRQAMEAALASQFTDIWGRMQRVKNDRRVQEILNDPEFQQKINSANPMDILSNARLLELANIIFSEDAAPEGGVISAPGSTAPGSSLPQEPKREVKIYRWTDNNGRVHYSDVESEQVRP